MAKMWKVDGIDCSRDYLWNGRRILAIRIAEVWAHAYSLDDPVDSVGHHNLRISIKRLRYSLEIFSVCFDEQETDAVLDNLSTMQDLLGDLHDADVLIPELQAVMEDQRVVEQNEVRFLAAEARERKAPLSLDEFRRDLERVSSFSSRPGILGLVNGLRHQKRTSYEGAVALWRRLEADGFRGRIERLVGLEQDLEEAHELMASSEHGGR